MSHRTNKTARSMYESSVHLIANVSAAMAAFFATGPLYALSIDWVLEFASTHYGDELIWPIRAFWFVVVGAITFGIARATVATAIAMGGLALGSKLF